MSSLILLSSNLVAYNIKLDKNGTNNYLIPLFNTIQVPNYNYIENIEELDQWNEEIIKVCKAPPLLFQEQAIMVQFTAAFSRNF